MRCIKLIIIYILIFQLVRLSSIAAVLEKETLAPTSSLAEDSEVRPSVHSEEDEMVIAYLRAHSEGGLISHKEIKNVKHSPEFKKWVQSHYVFTPFDGYEPYKGWKILEKERKKPDANMRRMFSGVAVIFGLASSIVMSSVIPLLISVFPAVFLLIPFLPYLSQQISKMTSWRGNGQVRIQTEIPIAALHNLHRDKENNKFSPINFMPFDGTYMGVNLEKLKQEFSRRKVIFSPKKALLIGPGMSVIEIFELLKSFPDLEEIHIVTVEYLNMLFEQMTAMSDLKKSSTKVIFHQTSVVGMPDEFEKQFDLVCMRHVVDLNYFTESQARQAMVDIYASLADHGVFIGSELEEYILDYLPFVANMKLFQSLVQPLATVRGQVMTVHVKSDSGLAELFQGNTNVAMSHAA